MFVKWFLFTGWLMQQITGYIEAEKYLNAYATFLPIGAENKQSRDRSVLVHLNQWALAHLKLGWIILLVS